MRISIPGHIGFPAIAAALLVFSNLHAADAPDDLESFRQKLVAEESKHTPQSPSGGRGSSMQIKMLQSLIAREDYDRALQTLESLGGYGMPPEFQDDWMALSEKLSKELNKKKEEVLEKWSKDLDQLVKDTKDGCLAAKTSDDLTPLLLRCSALQMRIQGGSTVMGQRIDRKLSGVSATLSSWTDYLDFKNAENAKSANERLRNLLSNSSSFPVLSATEIESRLVPEPGTKLDIRTLIAEVFEGVNTPDDLPAALERLKAVSQNPLRSSNDGLSGEQSRVEGFIQAWKAAETGDATQVRFGLSRLSSGLVDTQVYYAPLKTQIEERLILGKTAAWTKLTPNPDESSASYLGRILDELKSKGDYATLVEVLEFSSQQLNRNDAPEVYDNRTSIEQYLAGKRLEEAGDGLAAIANYRRALAYPQSKYTPAADTRDALRRLQEKFPDAFTGQDVILSEQIRILSEQMRVLSGQMRSMPNRAPGRPY